MVCVCEVCVYVCHSRVHEARAVCVRERGVIVCVSCVTHESMRPGHSLHSLEKFVESIVS